MKVLRIIAAGIITASILGTASVGLAGASHKNNVTFTAANSGLGFKAKCVSGLVTLSGFFVDTTPFDFTSDSTKITVDGSTTYNLTTSQTWASANDSATSSFSPTTLGSTTSFTTATIEFTGLPVFGDYKQTFHSFAC